MRWLTILGTLIALAPSPASATPVTITWTGNPTWYNNDWLSICQQTGQICEFWNDLQSRGISLGNNGVSDTPLTFSITFQDAISDSVGVYNTTADIHLEFGGLSIVSENRPVLLSNGFGFPGPGGGGFGFMSSFDPATSPVIGNYGGPPGHIQMRLDGIVAAPNRSLVAALHQPLPALSAFYCISLGGDCDVTGAFTAVSVSVPEFNAIFLLVAGLPGAWWFSRRSHHPLD